MHLNEMLAEIQALLDEDDDAEVLPETDDAPIRGVSTLHARPESLPDFSSDAEDWEVLQSRLRKSNQRDDFLIVTDTPDDVHLRRFRIRCSPIETLFQM